MKLHDLLLEKDLRAEKNNAWKPESEKGERALHDAYAKKHGKASTHKCRPIKDFKGNEHKEMAADWAQLKPKDGGGWRPMCRSCHTKYDEKYKHFNK